MVVGTLNLNVKSVPKKNLTESSVVLKFMVVDTKQTLLHETGFFFIVPKLFNVMRVISTKKVINSINKCELYFDDFCHEICLVSCKGYNYNST